VIVNNAGLPSVTIELAESYVNYAKLKATVDGVGKNKFTYKWMHNGYNEFTYEWMQEWMYDGHILNEKTDTLWIFLPGKHKGEYFCIVSNEHGDRAKSNPVVVERKFVKYCSQ